jgi:hypothetical protein
VITEQDLQEAIAECLGQRDPNANTCIKLAAYYTIRKELYGEPDQDIFPIYSRAAPVEQSEEYVSFNGDTDFSRAVNGMNAKRAWEIMDELVDAVRVVNPRLYRGLMKKVEEG